MFTLFFVSARSVGRVLCNVHYGYIIDKQHFGISINGLARLKSMDDGRIMKGTQSIMEIIL